jgi:16S rRNA (uracil1498-N3)-methyltransferase
MHHFFVNPEAISGTLVTIEGMAAHQIATVLRITPGERIIVLDDSGWEYEVQVATIDSKVVTGNVHSKRLSRSEPKTKIVLYQAVLRASRFEFVLQKATELGVCTFVPVICERSIVGEMRDVAHTKWDRWLRIIAEAAEQSERARLPALLPATTFQHAIEEAQGISIIAHERAKAPGARSVLARYVTPNETGKLPPRPLAVNLFIGPEGGFTSAEVARARDYNVIGVNLGPRILRAETAALVLATLALSAFGDMGL